MNLDHQHWLNVAKDVLSVLLTEDYTGRNTDAYNVAYYDKGLRGFHFPTPSYKALYQAVMTLRNKGKGVNWDTIITQVNGVILDHTLYTELIERFTSNLKPEFADKVDILCEYGLRSQAVEALTKASQQIVTGGHIDRTIDNLVNDVMTLGDKQIIGETADGSKADLDLLFDNPPRIYPKLGIAFIDEVMGGITPGRLTVLAGAYKSRKTSLIINWILNAYRQGMYPALMSFENNRRVSQLQFIAVLACEYILKSGRVPYTPEASVYWISADGLLKAGSSYQQWTQLKREAVDYARETWHAIGDGIRVYDRSLNGGNLSDILSVRNVIRRDMRLYGGDMFVIDHQGLVEERGEIYESTRSVSKQLQEISRLSDPHEISLFVLAQLNEGAINSDDGYSAGVKGGGDTSANADYLIRTTPIAIEGMKGVYYNDRAQVQVKHNRWGSSTSKHIVEFYPDAGLIKNQVLPIEEDVIF